MIVRGVSIVIIILTQNNTGENIISFMNYISHIIPTIVVFNIFLSYIRFIIEKYYEIFYKKKDIFFYSAFKFFIMILYISTFMGAIICFCKMNFININYSFQILL